MKKKRTLYLRLNDEFGRCLAEAFEDRFGIAVETNWNIVTMTKVTTRVDDKKLTKDQYEFISAYSRGFYKAAEEASSV